MLRVQIATTFFTCATINVVALTLQRMPVEIIDKDDDGTSATAPIEVDNEDQHPRICQMLSGSVAATRNKLYQEMVASGELRANSGKWESCKQFLEYHQENRDVQNLIDFVNSRRRFFGDRS